MKIIESILTKNPCYSAGRKIAVKGLMLHSVGCNQPKASAFINSWNSPSYSSACVHAFIDGNTGDVYQTLPWNHRGWHGGGSSNNTHIGVEMCEPACIKYTGGSTFTCSDLATARAVATRTYNSAVELFAYLCKQFNLDPLKDGVIISHAEGYKRGIATNHGDPEHLWNQLGMGYTMDGFRSAVKAAMNPPVVEKPVEKPVESVDKEEEEQMNYEQFYIFFKKAMNQHRNEQAELSAPSWSEEELAEAIACGITDGQRPADFMLRVEGSMMNLRTLKALKAELNALKEELNEALKKE